MTPASDDPADAVLPPQSPRKALILAALVVACVVAAYFTPLRDAFSESGRESLRHRIEELGPWAPPAFVALAAVGVSIGIPRLALAALAGVLFDWLLGSALAQVGTFIGCWATFAVGRALGRDYLDAAVRRRLPRAAAMLDFIGRHGFAANVMLRLSPVGNAFATNLLMAMSSVGTGVFLVGTFVGTLPETVIMALGGSAAGAAHAEGAASRLILAAAAMAVLVAGVALWTRRARRGAG